MPKYLIKKLWCCALLKKSLETLQELSISLAYDAKIYKWENILLFIQIVFFIHQIANVLLSLSYT